MEQEDCQVQIYTKLYTEVIYEMLQENELIVQLQLNALEHLCPEKIVLNHFSHYSV